jgi:hypothetical protein
MVWHGGIFMDKKEGKGYPTPRGESANRAKMKYNKKNYDNINLSLPKGYKAILKKHVEFTGESVNGFIKRSVDCQMESDVVGLLKNDISNQIKINV